MNALIINLTGMVILIINITDVVLNVLIIITFVIL